MDCWLFIGVDLVVGYLEWWLWFFGEIDDIV